MLTGSIILQWLFLAASAFAGWRERSQLTGALAECRRALDAQPFTSFQTALVLLGAALVIVNFIASAGLCKLKRWSRTLYLGSTIAGTVVVLLFFEPNLTTPVACFFSEWGTLFIGITLSLAYGSPLGHEFKNESFPPGGAGRPPPGAGIPEPRRPTQERNLRI